jgi:hypothetical protein
MTTLSVMNIRNELAHFLRNSDVLSVAVRGVTTISSETFVATSGQTVFSLAHYPVRNVRSLTVNGVAKYYVRDYTVDFSSGVVTLNTGASLGVSVIFSYDYGSSDKIFPDFPRDDLTLVSFPRIGVELTSMTTEPIGLGGANHLSTLLFTVIVAVPVNKDVDVAGGFGGLSDLEATMTLIRTAVSAGAKTFYSFPWISAQSMGPLLKGVNDKVLQQTCDFVIKGVFE